MSRVFINGILTEVGQGADEIISLRRQLAELKANSQAVLQTQSEAWQQEVAESQAREAKLREALRMALPDMRHDALRWQNDWRLSDSTVREAKEKELKWGEYARLLNQPADDTALREMIAKAGEVMRQRSMRVAWNIEPDANGPIESGIRALPGVTLEDLR